MAALSNLELLRKLLEQCDRLHELERADLVRQIKDAERSKPVSHASQLAGREHTHKLLKVMQAAKEPLPPREIARRLESEPRTVSRWLAAAKRCNFVERVDGARYQVRMVVPPL
jgi:predicted Rossmann fold nucleotide-binding protein DprA/Smf involved in DNA uptake